MWSGFECVWLRLPVVPFPGRLQSLPLDSHSRRLTSFFLAECGKHPTSPQLIALAAWRCVRSFPGLGGFLWHRVAQFVAILSTPESGEEAIATGGTTLLRIRLLSG